MLIFVDNNLISNLATDQTLKENFFKLLIDNNHFILLNPLSFLEAMNSSQEQKVTERLTLLKELPHKKLFKSGPQWLLELELFHYCENNQPLDSLTFFEQFISDLDDNNWDQFFEKIQLEMPNLIKLYPEMAHTHFFGKKVTIKNEDEQIRCVGYYMDENTTLNKGDYNYLLDIDFQNDHIKSNERCKENYSLFAKTYVEKLESYNINEFRIRIKNEINKYKLDIAKVYKMELRELILYFYFLKRIENIVPYCECKDSNLIINKLKDAPLKNFPGYNFHQLVHEYIVESKIIAKHSDPIDIINSYFAPYVDIYTCDKAHKECIRQVLQKCKSNVNFNKFYTKTEFIEKYLMF